MKKTVLRKLGKMSRLTIAALFLVCLCSNMIHASEKVEAQTLHEIQIQIDTNNANLTELFELVENQTELRFVYPASLKQDVKASFNFHYNSVSVADLLTEIGAETGLWFRQMNSTIAVNTENVWSKDEANIIPPQKVQTIEVQGKVIDEQSGEALPGVNIIVLDAEVETGRTIGTQTDLDGNYSISVPDELNTLVFSYIGYQRLEVNIDGRTEIDVQLSPDVQMLDDLVVVGYGFERKQDLTGSVSTIEGEELSVRSGTQLSQTLQGFMPGVMVTRSGSLPGSSANIRIRGITTIGDSQPLIIVDGVPYENIDDINENDIDQMTVLKDAAAASIYGARAAAGVILITTKNAKEGEINFEFDSNYGFERPTRWPGTVGAIRYMEMFNEMQWNDAGNPEDGEYTTFSRDEIANWIERNKTNPNKYPLTDWNSLLINDYAPKQNHQFTLSHGSEFIKTRASIQYEKADALYDYRSYERVMTRVNNDITFTDYLSTKVDISFNRSITEKPSANPLYSSYKYAPIYSAMYDDGRISGGKDGSNMYALLHNGGFENTWINKLNGRVSLDFKPLDKLTITGVLAPTFHSFKTKDFNKEIKYTDANDPTQIAGYISGYNETSLFEDRIDRQTLTKQLLVNYQDSFLDNHTLNFLAGYEDYSYFQESLNGQSIAFQLNDFPYLNLGNRDNMTNNGNAVESAYRSLFGRLKYDYYNTYYIQANFRADGSSRFHPDHRWGYFPSISAGWVVSNEPFMAKIKPLSYLKLRGSWGSLGNERIGYYPYQASINFTTDALFWQGNNIVSRLAAAQVNYAVKDISWETTQTWDIGIDANFFNNRLEMSFDYYEKATKDMLLKLEIPDFIGFEDPDQNAGTMHTTGWDIELGWRDQIRDFEYSVSFNVSDFKSTMGDLSGTVFLGDQIIREDSEYNEWYGYLSDGIFQTQQEVENSPVLVSNTRPGDLKYVDISGPEGKPDGEITPEHDKVLLGGSLPRLMFGSNINLNYKSFGISLALQGVAKQNSRIIPDMVMPFQANWLSPPDIINGNYWSYYNTEEENLNAKYPRLSNMVADNNYVMSDHWLIDGSYIRLKNISISYTLPQKITERLALDQITIHSSISDLFSIDNFPDGWDPEMVGNSYISQTFNFGVNVKF